MSEADFTTVGDLVSTLEPVKTVVEALFRRDVNLIKAEAALQFCLLELQKQSSELGKVMASALLQRVTQRRADHSGVLQYLLTGGPTPSPTPSDIDSVFCVPTNKKITEFVVSLLM